MTWLPWVLSGASLLTGAVVVLYLRWRLQRAEDREDMWRTSATQLTRGMTELAAAAREERTRQEGVTRVQRAQIDVATDDAAEAALATGDPDNRYVRDQLRAAFGAANPDSLADVPGPATADPAPGGDRGGNR